MLDRPPSPVNPNTTRVNRAGTTCNHVRQDIQVTAHEVFHARRNYGPQRHDLSNRQVRGSLRFENPFQDRVE